VRCPACGARNAEGAAWCTQCYADLQAPVEASPTAGPPATEPPATAPPAAAPPDAEREVRDGAARDVRTVAGEVEWRCRTCDGWSPLGRERCVTCGSPREGFGEVPPPPTIGATDRGRLVLATLVLPGLGHLLARRTGTGVARLVLALSWGIAGLVVARGVGGVAVLPAVPLLLGAVVVWAGSVRDVMALADGGPELLRPRVLSWLTAGVLGTTLLAVVVVAGSSRPVG
jgi:hypothetical protein